MVTIADLETPPQKGGATLARKWILDVNFNYGVSETPDWVRLFGVTDMSPSEDQTTQDGATFDSGGWGSTVVTALSWGWEVTVSRETAADGVTYDPAQEYLRAKGLRQSPGNTCEIRAYEWNGEDGPRVQSYQGLVSVGYSEQVGAQDALSMAQFTLGGQGRRYDVAHPLGPQEWEVSTPYARGDQVFGSDDSVLQAVVAGTSAAAGPGPTASSLTDGTVTWKVVLAP